jgi:hypothetical protein
LPPEKELRVPTGYEAGWTSDLVRMLWGRRKYLPPAGKQTLGRQVHSPSLYRLSYPVSFCTLKDEINIKEKVVKRKSFQLTVRMRHVSLTMEYFKRQVE